MLAAAKTHRSRRISNFKHKRCCDHVFCENLTSPTIASNTHLPRKKMLFLSSTTKAFTALLAAATLTQALSIDSRAPNSAAAAWSDDNPPAAKVVHVVLFNLKASLNETTKQMVSGHGIQPTDHLHLTPIHSSATTSSPSRTNAPSQPPTSHTSYPPPVDRTTAPRAPR